MIVVLFQNIVVTVVDLGVRGLVSGVVVPPVESDFREAGWLLQDNHRSKSAQLSGHAGTKQYNLDQFDIC